MLNIINGKNIILDVVTFMPFIFVLDRNFIRYESYNICVYSLPHALIQHMVQRLQESLQTGNMAEMRLFFPYHQYLDLYASSYFNTCICLTKKEILSNYIDVLLKTIGNSMELSSPEKKNIIEILEKRKIEEKSWHEIIISEWFPGDTEVIYLKPKCPKVDLLLDTSVSSASEAVSTILPILNSVINQG